MDQSAGLRERRRDLPAGKGMGKRTGDPPSRKNAKSDRETRTFFMPCEKKNFKKKMGWLS
jgi:hypothetical protein